jgi:hypothetical protein
MIAQFSRRRLWIWGAIAILALVLLTLLTAPAGNPIARGSTYGRSPGGYGAWYAYMERQNVEIRRWRQPVTALSEAIETPATLLRVYGNLRSQQIDAPLQSWVSQGNTLVLLGIRQPATSAPFSSEQTSEVGKVTVETRRRRDLETSETERLGDRFGAIVWERKMGQGRIVAATPSDLGANAYQAAEGNYPFLAQLVSEDGHPIWVDEYIHGFRDTSEPKSDRAPDTPRNWLAYLLDTPLILALWQGAVLLAVAIWAGNRRFGKPQPLVSPEPNNTQAYIGALAGVLEKAQQSEFAITTIGKQEQLQVQKALGLGSVLLEPEAVLDAWERQTGRSPQELHALLNSARHPRPMKGASLKNWLQQWRSIRATFGNNR